MSDCEIVRTYDEKVVLSLTLAEANVVRVALDRYAEADIPDATAECALAVAADIEETIDGLEHGQEDDEDESNQR